MSYKVDKLLAEVAALDASETTEFMGKLRGELGDADVRRLTFGLQAERAAEEGKRGLAASAAGLICRLGVKVDDRGRINEHELNAALRASGSSVELRIAWKNQLAAAGFID